jgi:F0F1-type ATP synthase assembly protein I
VEKNQKGALASAASVGIEIGVSVIVCLMVGHWADGKFGTTPWLTLLGVTLGTIVAMKAVMRTAKQAEK